MTLDTQTFQSVADLDNLRDHWRCILRQCRSATPFHTYEWTKANLSAFDNDGVRVLAFAEKHSDVVGILPLVIRQSRRYLNTRRWIEFAGLPHADYGGALVRSGCELVVAENLVDFLKARLPEWDGMYLDRLSQHDAFVQALVSAARQQGWHASVRQSDNVRRLSKEDYFRNKVEGSSRSLAKARRKLAMNGDIDFEVFDRADDVQQRLEGYARLHIARFAALRIQSPLASPAHRKFYEQMTAECCTAGYLWLSCLTCGGATVAMRISLLYNGMLHLYSTCFASEFEKYSPSMLQLEMLLDYAFHHGINSVDFGIGESPHKQQAGSLLQTPMVRIEIYHRRWPSVESRAYALTERACTRWPVLRQGGRMLRKVLPYGR